MDMRQIYVTMEDAFTGEEANRVICISQFTVSEDCVPCVERQREILLEWIERRANAQHDTFLNLISWYIK